MEIPRALASVKGVGYLFTIFLKSKIESMMDNLNKKGSGIKLKEFVFELRRGYLF